MPELPEVESIRLSLEPLLVTKEILEVTELRDDVLINPRNIDLEGSVFQALRRHGKYLLFDFLDKPYHMLVHLRMTGKLLYHETEVPFRPHTHVRFTLSNPRTFERAFLDYNDVRRFGHLVVFEDPADIPFPGFSTLGPDALDAVHFTKDYFYKMAQRHPRISIKGLLLDQTVVAGLGNIYADEALFRAGIHPKRRAGRISRRRLDKLHDAIRPLLLESIGLKGTSFSDYVDGLGKRGAFINQLAVYGKKGGHCIRCGAPLLTDRVAGRTTVYCKHCQR